jgi:hypothetical protein
MTSLNVATKSYAQAALEDRCVPRTPVRINAKLRPRGDTGFNVKVCDLSTAGFACEAVTSMRPGRLCWLTIPGYEGFEAEVVWNDGAVVGCAFSNFINQAIFDRIAKMYPAPVQTNIHHLADCRP